jgi:hypothetical protein
MNRVFVDVDTQHDFCAPGGALFVTGAPEAMGPCARLVRAAVASGAPLVGSVDSHAHDAWEFATNANLGPEGAKPNFPPHCVKGTPGWLKLPETLPERFYFVPVVPDDGAVGRIPAGTQAVYFEKEVYSLFANPNAAARSTPSRPPAPSSSWSSGSRRTTASAPRPSGSSTGSANGLRARARASWWPRTPSPPWSPRGGRPPARR